MDEITENNVIEKGKGAEHYIRVEFIHHCDTDFQGTDVEILVKERVTITNQTILAMLRTNNYRSLRDVQEEITDIFRDSYHDALSKIETLYKKLILEGKT